MSIQKKFICDHCQKVIDRNAITIEGNLYEFDSDHMEGVGEPVAGVNISQEGLSHYHRHCLIMLIDGGRSAAVHEWDETPIELHRSIRGHRPDPNQPPVMNPPRQKYVLGEGEHKIGD